jgi:lipoprotein-anchoring transpeptidase ErfK/SrfK
VTKPGIPPRPRHLVGVVAVLIAALVLAACSSGGSGSSSSSAPPSTAGSSTPTSSSPAAPSTSVASSTGPAAGSGAPVHIQLKFSDGSQFGVGIPVIAFFSKKITDATALQQATTLKVNGKSVTGGHWYFEAVSGHKGYPIEGDYRLRNYWPAHSSIFVDIAAKGLSAGTGLKYDDSLTSSFSIGASHVLTVNNSTHQMTVVTDGQPDGTYPVSLGASDTPTARGTKVIMEKGVSICMKGPGYDECGIKYTQRLTYGGEYLHSAPWNVSHIKSGINSSNGCTNLLPADAKKLYGELEIGDVVKFPNADGPAMTMGAGYGDWNVPWPLWLTGGDVKTI